MFFAYFLGGFQIFPIGNYGFTYLDASTIVLYFVIAKKLFWDRKPLEFSFNSASFFLLMILLTTFLSSIPSIVSCNATSILDFTKSCSHMLFLSGFAVIVCFFRIEYGVWDKILKHWIVLSIFLNLFGIYQIIARAYNLPLAWIEYNNISLIQNFLANDDGSGFTLGQLSLSFGNFFRATSIFSEPTALAGFDSLILGIVLAPILQGKKHFIKSKFIINTALVLSLLGLFLTFSVTAAVCLFFLLIVMLLIEKGKKKFRIIYISISAVAIIVIADLLVDAYLDTSVLGLFEQRITAMFSGALGTNVESTAGDSIGDRAANNSKAIALWIKNPILGSGIGNLAGDKETPLGNVENTLLACLVETGTLGGIAFVGWFLSMFILAYRTNKIFISDNKFHGDTVKRLSGILIYILTVQFVTNFISSNNYITPNLWLIISIVLSTINNILVDSGVNVKKIYLTNIPLKEKYYQYLAAYWNSKSKDKLRLGKEE